MNMNTEVYEKKTYKIIPIVRNTIRGPNTLL